GSSPRRILKQRNTPKPVRAASRRPRPSRTHSEQSQSLPSRHPLRGLPQMNRKYGLRTYSLHDTASHSHMRMRRGSRLNMATSVDDKIIHLTKAGSVPALDSTEIFQSGKE